LELRLALRAYQLEPTHQNAAAFMAVYARSHLIETDWISVRQNIDRQLRENTYFYDMAVLAYDLTNLDFGTDDEEEIEQLHLEAVNWVEHVASFSHNSTHNWEHIIYLGYLHDRGADGLSDVQDPRHFARPRRIGDTDPDLLFGGGPLVDGIFPTPEILVPIIEEAIQLGAWYISFNTG
jgi:hypothetical protein